MGLRRIARLSAAAVAVVAVGLGGCGGGDGGARDRDAVQAMVLETCAPGGDPAADPVCRCAYDRLLERFGAEELERLDQTLQSDPDALPDEARRIVLDCAFARIDPTPPTTRPIPTVASTTATTAAAAP